MDSAAVSDLRCMARPAAAAPAATGVLRAATLAIRPASCISARRANRAACNDFFDGSDFSRRPPARWDPQAARRDALHPGPETKRPAPRQAGAELLSERD